jgi:signal transduction histidine kinase
MRRCAAFFASLAAHPLAPTQNAEQAVVVTLVEEDRCAAPHVSGNGIGLTESRLRSAQGGLGSVGMRETAAESGRELVTGSRAGRGTTWEVRIPL